MGIDYRTVVVHSVSGDHGSEEDTSWEECGLESGARRAEVAETGVGKTEVG
jgi:hypothetical protein